MSDPENPADETGDLPGLEDHSAEDLVSDWTDDDWAEWFREEVNWKRMPLELSTYLGGFLQDHIANPVFSEGGDFTFSRLSFQEKLDFYESYYKHQEELARAASEAELEIAEDVTGDLGWEEDTEPVGTNITLPGGSVATVASGDGSAEQRFHVTGPMKVAGAAAAIAIAAGSFVLARGDDVATEPVPDAAVSPQTEEASDGAASSEESLEPAVESEQVDPVQIDPCDHVTAAQLAELSGMVFSEGEPIDDGTHNVCWFEPDEDSLGVTIRVFSPFSVDQYTLQSFRDRYPDATIVDDDLGYGHEGELRIFEGTYQKPGPDGEMIDCEGAEMHLQVHYLTTDRATLIPVGVDTTSRQYVAVGECLPTDRLEQEETARGVARLVFDALVAANEG